MNVTDDAAPVCPGCGGRMRLGERLRAMGNLPEPRTYDCAYFCRISVTIEHDREPELPAVNDDIPTVADNPPDPLKTRS
jgi:hypothetical protein